jgi:hypothetical protein
MNVRLSNEAWPRILESRHTRQSTRCPTISGSQTRGSGEGGPSLPRKETAVRPQQIPCSSAYTSGSAAVQFNYTRTLMIYICCTGVKIGAGTARLERSENVADLTFPQYLAGRVIGRRGGAGSPLTPATSIRMRRADSRAHSDASSCCAISNVPAGSLLDITGSMHQ